jgi:5-methylcytosine-specific restriction endonuclease McrA
LKEVQINQALKNAPKREMLRLILRPLFCKLCEQKIENWDEASIDHIIPNSKGGTNDYENHQLAHKSCNNRKGDQVPNNP